MSSVEVDLVIVGAGLMGAGLARAAREADPGLRITLIDAGPAIGSVPGRHLHEVDDPALWDRYNRSLRSGTQAHYVGAVANASPVTSLDEARAGLHTLAAFGHDGTELPGAAIAWNAGGMGAQWTAATPTPYGDEVFDVDGSQAWARDLEQARRILRVHDDPYEQDPAAAEVTGRLRGVFDDVSAPGRTVRPMPMAIRPASEDPGGRMIRTGPAAILSPLQQAGSGVEVMGDTLVSEIVMAGTRAVGVRIRDRVTNEQRVIRADRVAVCADALRTPQLLFASGIRPDALGKGLNEHVFASGKVIVDLDAVPVDLAAVRPPVDGEWHVSSLWLPHSGDAQPFQGQIMGSLEWDESGRRVTGYAVQLSWYIPTRISWANRVHFSAAERDVAGLPRMRIAFGYGDDDRRTIARGLVSQESAGRALGDFRSDRDAALLVPGASLHYTGTVRIGDDPRTSVADARGRVHGTDNVWVAGTGAIPTPMTANTTLTGMITAVRAGRDIAT